MSPDWNGAGHARTLGLSTVTFIYVRRLTMAAAFLAAVIVAAASEEPPADSPASAARKVPVVYSSDLLHPHDDPDDHFDLACLYALPEADLRAIILDHGELQAQRPGFAPVWQLNYLTRRHVPCALGLLSKLKSPNDQAFDQPAAHQNGVHLLLQTLRDSQEKVAIIFVGSARDIAAAFNREPGLFRNKVRSIHGFIGEASAPDFVEYNVSIDPQAYVCLMRSDLPFYWFPCFDGGLWQNHGHASYWRIHHRDVLEQAPEPLQRYFLYMLRKETNDPIAHLTLPTSASERSWLMGGERNLWAAGLLGLCVGREIKHNGADVAGFSAVDVTVGPNGAVQFGPKPGARRVMRLEILDRAHFAAAATARTAELLAAFPLAGR